MSDELTKAIEVLKEKYEYALKHMADGDKGFVTDPISWALYHTWEDYDKKARKKK